jgi:molybdenum cofactor cytidylyltransferase
MIAGIILAAGEGKRIGQHKLMLPLGTKTVIDWVLEAVVKSKLGKIILVVQPDDNKITKRGTKYKYRVTVVSNPDYKDGMSTSLQKALVELDNQKNIDGFCVMLGDQPFINSNIINLLIKAFQKGNKEIIVPYYQGKSGNPVLFDIAWKEDFMKITGDMGGRLLIRAYPDKVKKVAMKDNAILFDIDKEEDYIKAKTYLKISEKWCKRNEYQE